MICIVSSSDKNSFEKYAIWLCEIEPFIDFGTIKNTYYLAHWSLIYFCFLCFLNIGLKLFQQSPKKSPKLQVCYHFILKIQGRNKASPLENPQNCVTNQKPLPMKITLQYSILKFLLQYSQKFHVRNPTCFDFFFLHRPNAKSSITNFTYLHL